MRAIALAVLCGLLVCGPLSLQAQRSTPSRDEIAAVEASQYDQMRRFHVEAPLDVLGLPRGIYVEGFGAVFTAEVNLIVTPGVSMFHPTLTKEEIEHVHQAKERRLPEVRSLLRQLLVNSAASLDRVPPGEQVVVGLVLYYNPWEDRASLPRVMTMQGKRADLLEVVLHRAGPKALDNAIRVREE
jgi:hypothetical protein